MKDKTPSSRIKRSNSVSNAQKTEDTATHATDNDEPLPTREHNIIATETGDTTHMKNFTHMNPITPLPSPNAPNSALALN